MRGFKYAAGLGSVFLLFYILKLGKDLLLPFVYALFIWYLINIVTYAFSSIKIKNVKIPKWICFILSVSSILGLSALVVTIIMSNISVISNGFGGYWDRVEPKLIPLFELSGVRMPESFSVLLNKLDLRDLMPKVALNITSLAKDILFILVYLMFLFLEQKSVSIKIRMLAKGPEQKDDILRIIRKIQSDIRLYLGIKTFTSVLTGVLSYTIMASINLEFASFWALLIFILNYIPSIGSIIATLFPSLFALVQFDVSPQFFTIAVGVSLLQFFIGNFLEPRLMGNSLNLSPLVILFSLTFWGAIWGIPGAFLCVPLMVIFMIVLSHFPSTHPIAIMMSRRGYVTKS